jgi:hypothetical protein
MTIVNDTSKVVSELRYNFEHHWWSSILLLEWSIMLLESSIVLLEKIYSTRITHHDCHLIIIICLYYKPLVVLFQRLLFHIFCSKRSSFDWYWISLFNGTDHLIELWIELTCGSLKSLNIIKFLSKKWRKCQAARLGIRRSRILQLKGAGRKDMKVREELLSKIIEYLAKATTCNWFKSLHDTGPRF